MIICYLFRLKICMGICWFNFYFKEKVSLLELIYFESKICNLRFTFKISFCADTFRGFIIRALFLFLWMVNVTSGVTFFTKWSVKLRLFLAEFIINRNFKDSYGKKEDHLIGFIIESLEFRSYKILDRK